MKQNTLIKNDGQLARPLKVLVPLIKEEMEAGDEAGLPHYIKAGQMLIEARDQLPHGEWGVWLKRNFGKSRAAAYNYIKLAEHKGKVDLRSTTLHDIVRPNAPKTHRTGPEWLPEMKERMERLNLEKLSKPVTDEASREKLKRKLALDIIDIGYRALSTKLHPDKGGSREAMATLNDARDDLKEAVSDW
jgi:hypothetical protein